MASKTTKVCAECGQVIRRNYHICPNFMQTLDRLQTEFQQKVEQARVERGRVA